MTEPSLDAGRALVTGANRGLGLEVAKQLVERGFHVLLGCRDVRKGAAAVEGWASRSFELLELDVSDAGSIARAAEGLLAEGRALDVLVNNAAVHYDTWQTPSGADFELVDEAWRTNALGPWRLTAALAPLLRRSARGRVVNVSSGAGTLASMGAHTPAYSLTKAALNALTRMFADEFAADGVLVNSVCPGWVATDMGGGGRPIPEGAAGIVWAATLPDGAPTGGFFRDGQALDW